MLNNRGEAIDFLQTQYPDSQVRIVNEISNIPLNGEDKNRVWLFSPGAEFSSDEGVYSWLVDDETIVITNPTINLYRAYKQTRQRKENLNRAVKDQRLIEVVNTVANRQNHPLDYEKIVVVLDSIEQDYELKPIDIVLAYNVCQTEQEVAKLEQAVYG